MGHAGARVHAARAKKANDLLSRVDDALTRIEGVLDIKGLVIGETAADRIEALADRLEQVQREREEAEWEAAGAQP